MSRLCPVEMLAPERRISCDSGAEIFVLVRVVVPRRKASRGFEPQLAASPSMSKAVPSKAVPKECMALLKEASEMFSPNGLRAGHRWRGGASLVALVAVGSMAPWPMPMFEGSYGC